MRLLENNNYDLIIIENYLPLTIERNEKSKLIFANEIISEIRKMDYTNLQVIQCPQNISSLDEELKNILPQNKELSKTLKINI